MPVVYTPAHLPVESADALAEHWDVPESHSQTSHKSEGYIVW